MKALQLKKLVQRFIQQLNPQDAGYFFNGFLLNPIKVFGLSDQFKSLNLRKEDLVLLYSPTASTDNITLVVTDKNIHSKSRFIPISPSGIEDIAASDLQATHKVLLNKLTYEIVLEAKAKRKTFDDFTNKFKRYVDKKESDNQSFVIDYDYLQILQAEGNKIQQLSEDLNNNRQFTTTINTIIGKDDSSSMDFRAEHVILQDIIKVYQIITPLSDAKNKDGDLKVKFILAYLFEKLQGKDIIAALSIERINDFVQGEKFDQNIQKIQTATLFDLGPSYQAEFFLPAILKRLENNHFSNAATCLYRIASLITKADGNISEVEATALKGINAKLNQPKTKLAGVKQTDIDDNETLDDVMNELNTLIGLDNIKQSITELSNFLKIQKIRKEKGLKNTNNALHAVFMGPPGTGKTTVARLVSKIYKHLGYLTQGHLVETDRTGMVAGYVGQTALKVEEIVNASMNGVLFIDEAYTLAKDNKKDFGNEAIEVLLKKMEDHRDEFVVIVAGYPDEMKSFIGSNPGLQSRFNRYFTFDHYNPKELLGIFELFCKQNDFVLDEDAQEKMQFIFDELYEKRHKSFGNARVARNLFEKIIEYQANRIVSITPLTEDVLKTLTEADIPPVNQTVENILRFQTEEEEV